MSSRNERPVYRKCADLTNRRPYTIISNEQDPGARGLLCAWAQFDLTSRLIVVQSLLALSQVSALVAQSVEHILGKNGVTSSSLVEGLIYRG